MIAYLEDLERRIIPEVEERLLADWRTFLRGEWPEPIFAPKRERVLPSAVAWPDIPINDALEDLDLMALSQLRIVSDLLAGGSPLNVRCNYGTGIVPTMFGAELFVMPRELNTLPTTRPIGPEGVREALERPLPELNAGLMERVWRCRERFERVLEPYPKLKQYVHVYHPEWQGPMDICELLWGSGLFYALLDEPETVHGLLARITELYRRLMDAWGPSKKEAFHWGFMHRGGIVLRDDSAMNLSPAMFGEFIAPYDGELLARYGGVVHFCGRGDHFIERLAELPGLTGVNMSQPEYNDMERIYAQTVDRNIPLLGFPAGAAMAAGRPLRGRVHALT